METKTCNRCNQAKPIEEFARNKGMADGRLNQCTACRYRYKYKAGQTKRKRTSEQLRRDRNKYRAKYPEKRKAANAVAWAIFTGKLKRQSCEVCGKPHAQAHHDDYTKLLEVRWLCANHHTKWHAELARLAKRTP
jgi:hypothetical protein